MRNEDSEWFALSDDLWRRPYEIPRKLRILANHNIPFGVIAELRRAKIRVEAAADIGAATLADRDLWDLARKRGEVLLTTDADFWSDQRYPPEQYLGLMFVDAPPDEEKILRAIGYFLPFAKSFADGCLNLKVRVCADKFFLEMISYQGQRVSYEVRNKRGRLFARALNEPV